MNRFPAQWTGYNPHFFFATILTDPNFCQT